LEKYEKKILEKIKTENMFFKQCEFKRQVVLVLGKKESEGGGGR